MSIVIEILLCLTFLCYIGQLAIGLCMLLNNDFETKKEFYSFLIPFHPPIQKIKKLK